MTPERLQSGSSQSAIGSQQSSVGNWQSAFSLRSNCERDNRKSYFNHRSFSVGDNRIRKSSISQIQPAPFRFGQAIQ